MAVALPVIAGAFSVSAGIGAGLATLTGFLQAAGGALTVLGALTKKKDLLKVGAVMSLGGAGLNALGSEAAGAGVADAGMAGADEAAAGAAFDGLSSGAEAAAPNLTLDAAGQGAGGLDLSGSMPSGAELGNPSLMQTAMQRPPNLQMPQAPMDPLQEVGSRYTRDSLNQTLKTGQNKVNQMFGNLGETVDKVGAHLQKNRYLYQMGGSALESMLGPDAERMDWEKSLLARRLKNLNQPIALGPRSGG